MEYAHIYLTRNNFKFPYGMKTEFIVFSNLPTDRMGILARPIGGPATSHGARKNLNFVETEVLQRGRGRIDTKSDVWILGCFVSVSFKFQGYLITTFFMYLLLTGSRLDNREPNCVRSGGYVPQSYYLPMWILSLKCDGRSSMSAEVLSSIQGLSVVHQHRFIQGGLRKRTRASGLGDKDRAKFKANLVWNRPQKHEELLSISDQKIAEEKANLNKGKSNSHHKESRRGNMGRVETPLLMLMR